MVWKDSRIRSIYGLAVVQVHEDGGGFHKSNGYHQLYSSIDRYFNVLS